MLAALETPLLAVFAVDTAVRVRMPTASVTVLLTTFRGQIKTAVGERCAGFG